MHGSQSVVATLLRRTAAGRCAKERGAYVCIIRADKSVHPTTVEPLITSIRSCHISSSDGFTAHCKGVTGGVMHPCNSQITGR